MRTRKVIAAELAARNAEQRELFARGDAATQADADRAEALEVEIGELSSELASLQRMDALHAANADRQRAIDTPANRLPLPGMAPEGRYATQAPTAVAYDITEAPNQAMGAPQGANTGYVPLNALRSRVTNFVDKPGRSKELAAYRFGHFFLATCAQNERSKQYCRENGISLTYMVGDRAVNLAANEVINTQGGFLVPPEFENDIIDLREKYGVMRRLLKNRPMHSDTLSIPRRTGGLTAYFVGDNTAITDSTKGWDRVTLNAKKLAVLTLYSSELNEDAIIDLGNDFAGEIAYAFAEKEDDCGLNGDGTSPYGGIVGFRPAFLALSATRANIAGLVVGSGNLWSELVLGDFNTLKGRLPEYADNDRTCWVVHRAFWAGVMEKIALAAGGITEAGIAAGMRRAFLGYPVEISQKMPQSEANDVVCALLGDFYLAGSFGDRRQTTIAMSEHAYFANDELAIRGTERFDEVIHDIGNQSATASLRVPGPVVALCTAAS